MEKNQILNFWEIYNRSSDCKMHAYAIAACVMCASLGAAIFVILRDSSQNELDGIINVHVLIIHRRTMYCDGFYLPGGLIRLHACMSVLLKT